MNVGIITYHAAYNYGSALQAYATLAAVKKYGIDAKIINYRPDEQKKFYQCIIRTNYGLKTFIKDFQMYPVRKDRKLRMERFEQFFRDYYELTEEVNVPEKVGECFKQFDMLISGSDQILNKHSCELEHVQWEYMNPYLLKGFTGKKITYASSIANMSDQELDFIAHELKDFQSISLREPSSVKRLSSLLGRKIPFVSDPTFLLNAQEWASVIGIVENQEDYILYYSLESIIMQKQRLMELKRLAESQKCKIVIVTPFSAPFSKDSCFEYHYEYGPKEFLNMLANAKMVITDSYHGTILSVNLGKSIYSLCKNVGSEFRKTDILKFLGLEDRIIGSISEIKQSTLHPSDEMVQRRITELRIRSMGYLENSLMQK